MPADPRPPKKKLINRPMRPVPFAGQVVLRGCRACGATHPFADKTRFDPNELATYAVPTVCESCGGPLEPPFTREVRPVLLGFWGFIAELFLSVADKLFNLAKRIS